MADPVILIEAGWENSVRRLLGHEGSDTDAISNEHLRDALVLQAAEDYVKERVTTWETIMADTSSVPRRYLLRAVIYMVAYLMSDQGYAVKGVKQIKKGENSVTFEKGASVARTPSGFLDMVHSMIYLIKGTYVDPTVLDISYPTTDIITGENN